MAKDSFSEEELTVLATEIVNDPTFDQFLCEPSSNSSSLRSFSSSNTISNISLNISLSAPLIDEELTASISDIHNKNVIPKHTLSKSTSLYTASQSIHLSNDANVNIDLSNCISPLSKRRKSKKLKISKRRKSKKFKKNKKKNKRLSMPFIKQKNPTRKSKSTYAKTDIDLYNNKIWKLKDLIREIFSTNIEISERARNALILCHNSFISSCNLFIELRRIFCMNISEMTYTMFKFDSFPTDYFIRLKITQCITYWIKNYWFDDFILNNELKKQIELFQTDIKRIENKRISNEFMNLLNNALKLHNNLLEMNAMSNNVTIEKRFSDLTKLEMCNNSNFELMEFNPIDIAQQLTLLDAKIFNKIESRECTEQKWKSKNKNMVAPNILNMIAQFNDINKWVQITILKANSVKNRKSILKKMISMANYFMETNNLNSLCAFYSALTSKNIMSLNKTWKLLSNKKLKEFENIKQLFGWKMNKFKEIHNGLDSESPAIPHMGIILEKLFQIEEMYKKSKQKNNITSIDGVIDCSKMMLIYKQINNIKKLQSKKYKYTPDFLIQKLLITELQLNDQLNENVLDKLAKSLANSEKLL